MDSVPQQPVSTPPVPPTPKINILWMVISGLLALLLVAVVGMWAYTQLSSPTFYPPPIETETAQTSKAPPVGWKVYENQEIGVAFEYPEAWGEITQATATGDCYSTDAGYYSAAQLEQMRKDTADTNDPCKAVYLKVSGNIIAATQTPLHNKYPVPRGGFWGDLAGGAKDEAYIEQYCTHVIDAKCVLITNPHNIRFAHYSDGYIGLEEMGEFYLTHTAHQLYYGLSLSPSRLDPSKKADFEKLVASLRFI